MITGIDLAKLHNPEFLQFNRNVLSVIATGNKTTLKVAAENDALEALITQIANLFKTDTGSDITDELTALDIRRDDAILVLPFT